MGAPAGLAGGDLLAVGSCDGMERAGGYGCEDGGVASVGGGGLIVALRSGLWA